MLHASRFEEKLAKPDSNTYFVGSVKTRMLVGADTSGQLELLAVYFSAGARTKPHTHEKDQVLHFTEGRGIVATETEKRVCSAGDIVTVPAGECHWHGATREQSTCHISVRQPGGTNWQVESKNWSEY
jgi:quercetin dioxygenase-like cupin family protein